MTTLFLAGNTYAIKDSIKADGWKWSAPDKAWKKEVTESVNDILGRFTGQGNTNYPEATPERRHEMAKLFKGNKKGCRLATKSGVIIWTSKTYEEPKESTRMTAAEAKEHKYWNQDGRGYYIKEDAHDA